MLSGHLNLVNDIVFAPDGRTLISGGMDGLVKLWDINTCQEIATILTDDGNITTVALGTEGTLIATNANATMFIWP